MGSNHEKLVTLPLNLLKQKILILIPTAFFHDATTYDIMQKTEFISVPLREPTCTVCARFFFLWGGGWDKLVVIGAL